MGYEPKHAAGKKRKHRGPGHFFLKMLLGIVILILLFYFYLFLTA